MFDTELVVFELVLKKTIMNPINQIHNLHVNYIMAMMEMECLETYQHTDLKNLENY